MAKPMTEAQWQAFLLAGSRTAHLATADRGGRPSVAPVWYIFEAGELVFMTGADSLKARHIGENPRVCASVDDTDYPYAFVILHGDASIDRLSPEALLPWSTRIARRYVPAGEEQRFGKRNAVPGEILVRITPRKVLAYHGVAD